MNTPLKDRLKNRRNKKKSKNKQESFASKNKGNKSETGN